MTDRTPDEDVPTTNVHNAAPAPAEQVAPAKPDRDDAAGGGDTGALAEEIAEDGHAHVPLGT